jgi:penicillin-binding protein 1A
VQGAVVILRNEDAAILAESGGRRVHGGRRATYTDFNRVTQALRQPGSAMKPFVYLAGFRAGLFDLDTLVPDEPLSVSMGRTRPPKWIANYDGRYKGSIPVRQALAESRNTVAVWIAQQLGIGAVLATASDLGIATPLQPYPTTALGASEVTLLELANGYRALASSLRARPHAIRAVTDSEGRRVYLRDDIGVPFGGDERALEQIREALRGSIRLPSGTARALDAPAFSIPVMGKTGTTNDFRDALFVGSTYGMEGITVAVRIGFDDFSPLGRGETGGRTALPIFRRIMEAVYAAGLAGSVPSFPDELEQGISAYLSGSTEDLQDSAEPARDAPAEPATVLLEAL